ncbi:ALA-interacting subunit 3-like [Vicia villosa]|uniref:ALA-interacting subunit 3-like n=1 Tax=Vicia villosa TaxID=3911 RepID=UPI00273C3654|nr:ALA-interacting subunit 3-like [Vicia villosa]
MASTSTTAPGSSDSTSTRRNTMCNAYYKFMQQELPAQRPILTPRVIILGFFLISAVFISFGVASLIASRKVVEIVYGYEADCLSNITDKVAYIQNPGTDKTCNITLNVPKNMEAPTFVYYQLENFYQNHKRYVHSRSIKQLRNDKYMTLTDDCKPEDELNSTAAIVPCGLVAWSLFNDTYRFSINGKNLMVNKSGISWKSDREHKFGKDVFPKNFQNSSIIGGAHLDTSIPLSGQEDLMVWMRTAVLPTFRKLYGRIEVDLNEGDTINVTIQNQYNTYSFNGKKKLVLSTTSWLGGKNDFIGIAYLTVGGVCLFLSMFFTIGYFLKPRQLGNPSDLSWNRK